MSRLDAGFAPIGPPHDLLSAEGAAWLTEESQRIAVHAFKAHGELRRPFALVLARRNPTTRLSFPRPRSLLLWLDPNLCGTQKDKDALAAGLRKTLVRTEAFALALAFESWLLRASRGPQDENFKQVLKEWTGRIREHPDRTEVVSLSVEHPALAPAGYAMHMGHILRDHVGRPTLSGWENWGDGEGGMGRFMRMLEEDDGGG